MNHNCDDFNRFYHTHPPAASRPKKKTFGDVTQSPLGGRSKGSPRRGGFITTERFRHQSKRANTIWPSFAEISTINDLMVGLRPGRCNEAYFGRPSPLMPLLMGSSTLLGIVPTLCAINYPCAPLCAVPAVVPFPVPFFFRSEPKPSGAAL